MTKIKKNSHNLPQNTTLLISFPTYIKKLLKKEVVPYK